MSMCKRLHLPNLIAIIIFNNCVQFYLFFICLWISLEEFLWPFLNRLIVLLPKSSGVVS